MERRRFNASERAALWLAAGGECSSCGTTLDAGWHADHVRPYAQGGETDVLNGQALCPTCNLRKGSEMGEWTVPTGLKPFRWQKEAKDEVMASLGRDDSHGLIAVSPGAGKTLFALWVASLIRKQGLVDKIVVVVPSIDLKHQWRGVATGFGIELNTKSIYPAADEDGVALTYQALTEVAVPTLRKLSRSALVVGDEIHRAGADSEEAVWGERYERAFGDAFFNLLMSGTPVRPPGKGKLPFVSYKGDPPTAKALYTYSYGDALTDECVRELIFPSYDGDVEWFDNSVWDRVKFSISDNVSEKTAAARYRNALSPKGKLLVGTMKLANDRLSHLRQYEQANAGGLILAKDQRHAEKLQSVIQRISREEAALVISDNDQAAEDLKAFSAGASRWVVGVNKISEGVNIPRLRVEVYATNVRDSEAGFRQRALRVGRYVDEEELAKRKNRRAYVYLLADAKLLGYAEDMKIERDHALLEKEKRVRENGHPDTLQDMLPELEPENPVTSNPDHYVTITQEFKAEPEQMSYAEALRLQNPGIAHLTPEDIFGVIRANASAIAETTGGSTSPSHHDGATKEERKEDLRRELARLVGFAVKKHDLEYSYVNNEINERALRANRKEFTEEELEEALLWVKGEYAVW